MPPADREQSAGPALSSVLQRDAPDPLHIQISGRLRELVTSRTWPPHHRLLPELQLAKELGVARGTLRKAVKALVDEGLLIQVQGRGTFVTSRGFRGPVVHDLLSLADAMASHGIRADTEVLSREIVQPTARMLTLLELTAPGPALLRLERVRRAEDSPVASFVNHVRRDLVPELDDRQLASQSLYTLIETAVGQRIAAGRRTFEARAAGPEMAERLEVVVGTPLQYFEQVTYLEDGRAVELSEVWVRSDRVRLTSMVSRGPEPSPESG